MSNSSGSGEEDINGNHSEDAGASTLPVPAPDADKREYSWCKDDDETARTFIFERMASADIDGPIFVKNMQLAYDWVRNAKVPSTPRKRPELKAVGKDDA